MLNIFSSCSLEMSTLMLRFDNKTPYIKHTKMDVNKLKIIVGKLNQVEKIWLNGYLTGSIETENFNHGDLQSNSV